MNGIQSCRSHTVSPQGPGGGSSVRISVIIPAFNEEKAIGKCLESLSRLNSPRPDFEVILVDNGSSDRTLEIARSFGSSLSLAIIQQPGVHVSALRNLGAASAKGEIFAFLDADCVVPPTWLSQASSLLMRDGAGVIGAPHDIPRDASWVVRKWYGDRKPIRSGSVSYIAGANLIVRRRDFYLAGGFDGRLETNEDCEFCQRVRRAGLPVTSFPQIRVVHLNFPDTLQAFYANERWHGRDVFRVFLRDVLAFQNGGAVSFAIYTLVSLVGVAAGGILAVASGKFELLAGSLLAITFPPLFFSLRAAASNGRLGDLLPLTILYLTYGVARAACLLDFKTWTDGTRKA